MADEKNFDATTEKDTNCSEAVCIDAQRIYDSCGDKDCLADLRVYFTDRNQELVDSAVNVRLRDADILTVLVDIEPVPFHRGFYSIDMTYFFEVCIDAFAFPGAPPTLIEGICISNKKVILYGSEGNVKVFSSELSCDDFDKQARMTRNLPIATVQVARPIALSARFCTSSQQNCILPCKVPEKVKERFGGEFEHSCCKDIYATIGVFSIVQLQRNVQMLIPSYDFCIPEKKCHSSSDNPCEIFSKLDFPTNEFFPPNVDDLTGNETPSCSFGCSPCTNYTE